MILIPDGYLSFTCINCGGSLESFGHDESSRASVKAWEKQHGFHCTVGDESDTDWLKVVHTITAEPYTDGLIA